MKKQSIWIALILILVVSTTCASAAMSEQSIRLKIGQAVLMEPDNIRIEVVKIDDSVNYAKINISGQGHASGRELSGAAGQYLTPNVAYNSPSGNVDILLEAVYADYIDLKIESTFNLMIDDYVDIDSGGEQVPTVTVPELKLKKTIDKTSMQVDDTAVISIELKNRGNGSATSIDLDELMMQDGISIEGTLPDTSGTTVAADQTRTFQYKIKATKEGNYFIQPTTVYYKSDSGVNYEGTTNSLTLSVAKPPELKPALETDIEIDNLRLYKGEETTIQITITNNGDAPANNVVITGVVDGTPRDGIEYLEEDFEATFKSIESGQSETYFFEPVVTAREVGSYVIKLGIDYDGGSTDATSQKIRVIKKVYRVDDFYKYAPILIIPVVLILLVFGIQFMKRYMAYRF